MRNQRPVNPSTIIDSSKVPPQVVSLLGNPRVLANPEALGQIKTHIPPEVLPMFSQLLGEARSILANSLDMVFLAGVITASVALMITIFLKEVPLSRGEATVESKGADGKRVGEETRALD